MEEEMTLTSAQKVDIVVIARRETSKQSLYVEFRVLVGVLIIDLGGSPVRAYRAQLTLTRHRSVEHVVVWLRCINLPTCSWQCDLPFQ